MIWTKIFMIPMDISKKMILAVTIIVVLIVVILPSVVYLASDFFLKDSSEVANLEKYQKIAINRIKSDYNYKNLEGSNLIEIATPIKCGNKCYEFSYRYDVNEEILDSVDKIVVDLKVIEDKVENFSITEKNLITSFEECKNKGYEVFYPDCIGCNPYCISPSNIRFEKTD